MEHRIRALAGLVALAALLLPALASPATADERPRVVVLTDISNEPDDEESMVRFLVYSNEWEVEGLIATTSTHLRDRTREDLIRRQIEAYGQVRDNLARHAAGFPTTEALLAVTHTGQPAYGMEAVGPGKDSPGSRHIVEVVDRDDSRPVWISVWGGVNTLAQALRDVREARSEAELAAFVKKLRVYTISDQDDAGRWLRLEFPGLFYVVSPSNTHWKEYWRATWTGIAGDRHYANGPFHAFEQVDNPWLERNVIGGHGPLGALYPRLEYIMEGDTPSFLGLVDNGLGWDESPAYGGWGGRYVLYQSYAETRPIWTNSMDSRDTVVADDGHTYTSDQATIWRWREHFQNDFAARMDWCVAEEREQANHNPVAILGGDATKEIVGIEARPGETVVLSAAESRDPDGDAITRSWFVYPEAGTHGGTVTLSAAHGPETSLVAPEVKSPETIHVILQIEDQGEPHLFAYRRAIVTVRP